MNVLVSQLTDSPNPIERSQIEEYSGKFGLINSSLDREITTRSVHIALVGGAIVGLASSDQLPDTEQTRECKLYYLIVHPSYRRQRELHVGSKLLHAVEDFHRNNGMNRIILRSLQSAEDFYALNNYEGGLFGQGYLYKKLSG